MVGRTPGRTPISVNLGRSDRRGLETRFLPPQDAVGASGATASKLTPIGRTPWSAADAPVGLLAPCNLPVSLFRQRDEASRADQGVRPTVARKLPSALSSRKKYHRQTSSTAG